MLEAAGRAIRIERRPLVVLAGLLADQAAVVSGLGAAEYVMRPAGFAGGVGPQVRHCVDHVAALVAGMPAGRIDYESRRRGSPLETDRARGLAALLDLEWRLLAQAAPDLDRPVLVFDRLDPAGPPDEFVSTVGRELASAVSHTTHHNALIAAMVRAVGRPVPDRLGFAASTSAFLDRLSCAR